MLKGRILNDNVSFRFLATCPEVSCRTRRAAITLAFGELPPIVPPTKPRCRLHSDNGALAATIEIGNRRPLERICIPFLDGPADR